MSFNINNYKKINKVAIYAKIPTESIYGKSNTSSVDGDKNSWDEIRKTLEDFLFGDNDACLHLVPFEFCKKNGLADYTVDTYEEGVSTTNRYEDKIKDLDKQVIYDFWLSIKDSDEFKGWGSLERLSNLMNSLQVNNDSVKKIDENEKSLIDFGIEYWQNYYIYHGVSDVNTTTTKSKIFEANTILGSGTINFKIAPNTSTFDINSMLTNNGFLGTALKWTSAATGFLPLLDMPQTSSYNGIENPEFTFKSYIDLEEWRKEHPDVTDAEEIIKQCYNDPIARLYGLILPRREEGMPIDKWLDAMFNAAGGEKTSGKNDKYRSENNNDAYNRQLNEAIKYGENIKKWIKSKEKSSNSFVSMLGTVGTTITNFIAEHHDIIYDLFGDTYLLRPPFMYQKGINEKSRSVDVRIGPLQIEGCIIKSIDLGIPTFMYDYAMPPYITLDITVKTNRMPNVEMFRKLFHSELAELEINNNEYKELKQNDSLLKK